LIAALESESVNKRRGWLFFIVSSLTIIPQDYYYYYYSMNIIPLSLI